MTRGAVARTPAPPATGVQTLFTISIRHAFYNDAHERSDDLALVPTPETDALLRRFRIACRPVGSDTIIAAAPAAIAGLRALVADEGGWARLCFALVPRLPAFVAVTALPLTGGGAAGKLYCSNLDVVADDAGGWTAGGADGVTAALLRPVAVRRPAVPMPARGGIGLADLSGRIVTRAAVAGGPAALDLTGQPAGLYRALPLKADGTPSARGKAVPDGYVYLPGPPGAIGLLDLLLARPDGQGEAGAFPLAPDGTVRPVAITLRFAARRTIWRYYVVAQRGRLEPDLAITGEGARFARSTVVLPGGGEAALFTADAALPLARSSPYRFKLSGARQGADGGRNAVAIARLPVAPPSPVWPADTGDPTTGGSDIYVYV